MDISTQWYVVLTKPRQEQRALEHLEQQGASAFLPLFQRELIAKGVRTLRAEPLFPGYLFLQSSPADPLLSKIRFTLGARGLLYFGKQPAVVGTLLVDDLQQCTVYNERDLLHKKGQKVALRSGPFQYTEAIFQEYDGAKRAIILLSLLGQQSQLLVEVSELTIV